MAAKVIQQRFRIFTTLSQNFSFNLRTRTCAYDHTQMLISQQSKSGRARIVEGKAAVTS